MYFIGTRPNPRGIPICSDFPQNPYGSFKLQVASSGAFVTASSAAPNLIATPGSSGAAAATFTSAYVPNAGTLQLAGTGQYVTADQSGSAVLAAARATASAWERFTIRRKVGAAADVYSIRAGSNGLYVTVAGDGSLVNNGANEAVAAGFRFVAA